MDDGDRREAAIARLKAKREFWLHLFVYLAVNGFLVIVWLVTSSDGHFWPIWPIGGWGIGLAAHAAETYWRPITEDSIQREMGRTPH